MNHGWIKSLLIAVLIFLAAGAGWWAGRVTLRPDKVTPTQSHEVVWADVIEASVGRTLPYPTTVRQPSVPVAYNGISGIVTQVAKGEANVGDVLYQVGDVPVRAVHANQPMWRNLSLKVSGNDVRALQELLAKLGYFHEQATGEFTSETEDAVKAWQKAEGRTPSGIVQQGELISFPRLPVQVTPGEEIIVGKPLTGGEEAIRAPTGQREFLIKLTEDQARLVPGDAIVEVTYEKHVWKAVVAQTRQDDLASYELILAGLDGGAVCGSECDVLPLDPRLTLRSKVIVVPQTSGMAVPTAAVRTAGDGKSYVETAAGNVPVTVRGSGQGLAIVEGVKLGDRVKVGGTITKQGEASGANQPTGPGKAAPSASESGG